jgi:HD-GYP domain-containing protein (c-di-GMP phosphodiesterase class II)
MAKKKPSENLERVQALPEDLTFFQQPAPSERVRLQQFHYVRMLMRRVRAERHLDSEFSILVAEARTISSAACGAVLAFDLQAMPVVRVVDPPGDAHFRSLVLGELPSNNLAAFLHQLRREAVLEPSTPQWSLASQIQELICPTTNLTAMRFIPLYSQHDLLGFLVLAENERSRFAAENELFASVARNIADLLSRERSDSLTHIQYIALLRFIARAVDVSQLTQTKHNEYVAEYARRLAIEAGLSIEEARNIYLAGLFHDVGKIAIPHDILWKPGPLTPPEWEVMRRHPLYSADMLSPVAEYHPLVPLVRAHHENYDGSGYPDGLRGLEIPLGARILTVVDAFSAMTDRRVYHSPIGVQDAIAELKREAGSQFDPYVVDLFLGQPFIHPLDN